MVWSRNCAAKMRAWRGPSAQTPSDRWCPCRGDEPRRAWRRRRGRPAVAATFARSRRSFPCFPAHRRCSASRPACRRRRCRGRKRRRRSRQPDRLRRLGACRSTTTHRAGSNARRGVEAALAIYRDAPLGAQPTGKRPRELPSAGERPPRRWARLIAHRRVLTTRGRGDPELATVAQKARAVSVTLFSARGVTRVSGRVGWTEARLLALLRAGLDNFRPRV